MPYFMHTNDADSRRYTRGWTAPCHLLAAQSLTLNSAQKQVIAHVEGVDAISVRRIFIFYLCSRNNFIQDVSHVCVLATLVSEASLASQLSVFLCMLPLCLFGSLTCETRNYREGALVRIHEWLLIAKVISSDMKQSLSLVTVGNDRLFL